MAPKEGFLMQQRTSRWLVNLVNRWYFQGLSRLRVAKGDEILDDLYPQLRAEVSRAAHARCGRWIVW